METEKLGMLLTFMTTIVFTFILVVNQQAMLRVFDFVNVLGDEMENMGISPSIFILVMLVGSLLVVGIVYYGLITFKFKGLPSNRTLSKLSKEVGEEPFQLEKVSGKWIAITKDKE